MSNQNGNGVNGAFKVEKGIPSPPKYNQKYPFKDMEVGDSFAVPADFRWETIVNSAAAYGKANNKKFSCRKTAEGRRIWRIE